MKTSTEQIKDLVEQIRAIGETIKGIKWTEKEIAHSEMGLHVEALEGYLDCALGRAVTVLNTSKHLAKSPRNSTTGPFA